MKNISSVLIALPVLSIAGKSNNTFISNVSQNGDNTSFAIHSGNAACVSLRVMNGSNFKISNGKQVFVNGTCTSLATA